MRKFYLLSIALLLLVYYCEAAPQGKQLNDETNQIECETCDDCENSNWQMDSELKKCKSCGIFIVNDKIKKGCTEDFKNINAKLIYNCTKTKCNNIQKNECYKCSSQNDINCIEITNKTKTEYCPKLTTKCITKLDEKGYTVRGCESDNIRCDTVNTTGSCFEFQEYKRNLNIIKEDHLKCYQCNGTECITVNSKQLQYCSIYKKNDLCYTDVLSETSVIRGCMSNLTAPQNSSQTLKTCPGNNCNSENAIEYIECVNCKTEDGNDCYRDKNFKGIEKCTVSSKLKTCKIKKLLNHKNNKEKCFTFYKNGKIERGCETIDSKNTDKTYCVENSCNNECTPLICYSCDSVTDPNCKNNLEKAYSSDCHKDTCYSCTNYEGHVFRGCGAKQNNTMKCQTCSSGVKCNTDIPNKPNPPPSPPSPVKNLTCYSCNSKDDPNCAQLKNVSAIKNITCEKECSVTIQNGNTVRGCVSKIFPCDPEKKNCLICNTTLCNDDIYPKDRLKCYYCDDKSGACNEEQKSVNLLPCQNYNSTDSCYAYAISDSNNKTKMYRGCYSDPVFSLCLKQGTKKCKTCNNANGCNSFPLQSKSKLSCIKCEKNNMTCAWGHNTNKKINCTKEYFYYSEESCYIKKFNNNEVQRGCSLDDNICPEGDANCTLCSKDACNNENVITQSCLQCNSSIVDQKTKCTSAKNIMATKCLGIIPYENRGCYTKREGKNVIRGCAIKLGENFENCKNEKDKKKCEICEKDGCNKSSGNIISVAFITVLVSVIIYVFQ